MKKEHSRRYAYVALSISLPDNLKVFLSSGYHDYYSFAFV